VINRCFVAMSKATNRTCVVHGIQWTQEMVAVEH
jgi:hypothetical protein